MKKERDLDDIDKDIIRILQENAKTSYREIQDKLGISIGTIHNRINKLESSDRSSPGRSTGCNLPWFVWITKGNK